MADNQELNEWGELAHDPLAHIAHCRKDGRWIMEQVLRADQREQLRLYRGYDREWQSAFDAEPVEYRKENRARYRANRWLRECIVSGNH